VPDSGISPRLPCLTLCRSLPSAVNSQFVRQEIAKLERRYSSRAMMTRSDDSASVSSPTKLQGALHMHGRRRVPVCKSIVRSRPPAGLLCGTSLCEHGACRQKPRRPTAGPLMSSPNPSHHRGNKLPKPLVAASGLPFWANGASGLGSQIPSQERVWKGWANVGPRQEVSS
jgi:hypothetical protein